MTPTTPHLPAPLSPMERLANAVIDAQARKDADKGREWLDAQAKRGAVLDRDLPSVWRVG